MQKGELLQFGAGVAAGALGAAALEFGPRFAADRKHLAILELRGGLISADISIVDSTRPDMQAQPWDIVVNDPHIFDRVLRDGIQGAGEGYMAREWDVAQFDEFMYRLTKGNLDQQISANPLFKATQKARSAYNAMRFAVDRNAQARELAATQYDLGNDFFKAWLDNRMLYTCGYWKDAETLDEAQEAKLKLSLEKLKLGEPRADGRRKRLLDIGGGWGGLALYAAENYDVDVVSISISGEQIKEAEARKALLPIDVQDRVQFRFQDYRDVNDGPYDAIVTMGMVEHIGSENYPTMMETVRDNLDENGLYLLHTIGQNGESSAVSDWVTKYIFPNSEIPTTTAIATAANGTLTMEDLHNFGPYYDKTCMAWFERFNEKWEDIKRQPEFMNNFNDPDFRKLFKSPDQFYRAWKMYLLGSAGCFRSRTLQLWQIVYSKDGIPGGYESVR